MRSSMGSPTARRSPWISVATGSGTTITTPHADPCHPGHAYGASPPGEEESPGGHRPLPGATRQTPRPRRPRSRRRTRARSWPRRTGRRPCADCNPLGRAPGAALRRRPPPAAGRAPGHGHRRARTAPSSTSSHGVNPLGVRVASFKRPTEVELAHDYLWRVHRPVPGRRRDHRSSTAATTRTCWSCGSTTSCPRSMWQPPLRPHRATSSSCSPTRAPTILKFFLHISKDEQAARLQARLDDPAEALEVRARRPRRAQALGRLPGRASPRRLDETSTDAAPWYVDPRQPQVVPQPGDRQVLIDTLEGLDLALPRSPDPTSSRRSSDR